MKLPKTYWGRFDRHGRITIPSELRHQLRLRPGSRVVLIVRRGAIYLYPLHVWHQRQQRRKQR